MYGSNGDILVFESIFSCYKPPQPNKGSAAKGGLFRMVNRVGRETKVL